MKSRARTLRFGATGLALLGLLIGSIAAAPPAYAADSVSITPATQTVTSNTLATYTLTYSCSTTGNCLGSTVTIPTNTVTNNGANTDFSPWVAAGTCPSMTKTAGLVTFTLGTVLTGTYSCNFTVRAPNKTTLNGAKATIAPTFSSSGGSVTAITPAVINLTAGRNVGLSGGVNPPSVLSGAPLTLSFSLTCGASQTTPNGDLGLTALSITDLLPSNFTFSSVSTAPAVLPGTLSAPAAGTSGGSITYTGDGSECLSPANNRIIFTVQGTAATNGVPDPVGATVCHTPNAAFTYIDGFSATATSAPASPCATVIDRDWRTGKGVTPKTMANRGQYEALDDSVPTLYTFPGDWDGASSTNYTITASTLPATTNAGLSYDIKDPLPCLDNVSGVSYVSNAPGVACANPAYIPRVITVAGFSPAAGGTIDLLLANGTTTSVPYVAGTGWTLPTSPAVSEIDIPPFPQQGTNNFGVITYTVTGYASPAAEPGHILTNLTTVDAYISGTSTLVKTTQGQSASILVADPATYGAQGLMFANAATTYTGNCVERVQLQGSGIEITQAPSAALHLSYLSPEGVGAISVPPLTLTMVGPGGRTYTATGLTVVNQVVDYNGTGRTLLEWTIPAGLATQPGFYSLSLGGFDVNLGAGCAGTFHNAMTIGYAAGIPSCAVAGANQTPPQLPPGDSELNTNGSPIVDNFCGASAPLQVAAINPGFSVDKLVQGNLDATQIGAGGTGNVSVDGGAATYTVSFTNTGQSTLTDPVMYDLLPRIGDTRASSNTPRGSEFAVALTGIGALPPNLTVSYSEAINPCRAEVLSPNPGCVDDWSTTAPSPLSNTTALRFAYSGNVPVSAGFTSTYTVSTPPTAAGNIAWNSIGTNVTAGSTLLGAAESSLTGLRAQSAQPAISKVAEPSTVTAAGEEVVYTITVTNNTAVTLADVGVTDALVNSAPSSVAPEVTCTELTTPAGACSGSTTTLVAGQSATFTATYVVTQADVDHGSVSDRATATATPPSGPNLSNSSGIVTVVAMPDPELTLVKSATPGTVSAIGDIVEYEFEVTNAGNVTLSELVIDEVSFSGSGAMSAIICPSGSIAPQQTVTCEASYPVTQADLTSGVIDNTATATATTPAGDAVTSDESSASVGVEQSASLTLVKSAVPSDEGSYNVGQLVTYSFIVSNTGNVPVTDITIDEVSFSGTGALSAIDCPQTSLDPAQQLACTATYTLTQEDVDSTETENTARALGTSATGPVTSNESTVTTPQIPLSSIALAKTANTTFVDAADDVVTYSFVVENTGNVTVHDIVVDETDFSGSGTAPTVTCPATELAPGAQLECAATYSITQADMNAGSVANTAIATATDTADEEVSSAPSTWTVTANVAPALSLVKTADLDDYDTVGSIIDFSFEVTNTGNVLITDIGIDEGVFTGSGVLGAIECPSEDYLQPGDSLICHAEYEVVQADIDRGSVVNTATAFGSATGSGAAVASESSTATVPAVQSPSLELVKSATPTTVDAAGDTVTYEFFVSNTGNVTLSALTISETEFSGTGSAPIVACGSDELAPGADLTCTATYQVTQEDVDSGVLNNTAVATATAGSEEVESTESSAAVSILRTAALSLVKSADPASPATIASGDTITYSFVVTNTGNVTITDPTVEEGEFTGTGTLPPLTCDDITSLAPGGQFTCSTVYTVTQQDVDSGSLVNTATATGEGPDGTDPISPPSSTVAVPQPAAPSLSLVKSTATSKLETVGQIVTYTFEVTNTGNTTATEIVISEDEFTGDGVLPSADCPTEPLLPGQTVTCVARYSVVASDLDGTALSNTATATAHTPAGGTVSSDSSSAIIAEVADVRPPLALTGGGIYWLASLAALILVGGGALLMLAVRRRVVR